MTNPTISPTMRPIFGLCDEPAKCRKISIQLIAKRWEGGDRFQFNKKQDQQIQSSNLDLHCQMRKGDGNSHHNSTYFP